MGHKGLMRNPERGTHKGLVRNPGHGTQGVNEESRAWDTQGVMRDPGHGTQGGSRLLSVLS